MDFNGKKVKRVAPISLSLKAIQFHIHALKKEREREREREREMLKILYPCGSALSTTFKILNFKVP